MLPICDIGILDAFFCIFIPLFNFFLYSLEYASVVQWLVSSATTPLAQVCSQPDHVAHSLPSCSSSFGLVKKWVCREIWEGKLWWPLNTGGLKTNEAEITTTSMHSYSICPNFNITFILWKKTLRVTNKVFFSKILSRLL